MKLQKRNLLQRIGELLARWMRTVILPHAFACHLAGAVVLVFLSALGALGQEVAPITLYQAIREGKVKATFQGTGASSGDSVKVTLLKSAKDGNARLELILPLGSRLHSERPESQDMIVMTVQGRAFGSGSYAPIRSSCLIASRSPATYVLSAFCAEFHKENPSSSDRFSLQDIRDPMIECIGKNGKQLSIAAEQAAVWIHTDNLTYQEVNEKFSVSQADWAQAAAVVAQCQNEVQSGNAANEVRATACTNENAGGELKAPSQKMADAHYAAGRYDLAEAEYKSILKIEEQTSGDLSLAVASAQSGLGQVYYAQGRYADAKPLFERALAIRRRQLAPDDLDIAASLTSLARLDYALGKNTEAEIEYQKALSIYTKASGLNPAVASVLNNLAEIFKESGDYERAKVYYQRALSIDEQALGAGHPAVATDLNNLAELYRSQGDYKHAEELYRHSLLLREKILGQAHPALAATLTGLAAVYQDQGRYADAEPLYRRALLIDEKALGSEHPDVAVALRNLAGLYDDKQMYTEAQVFLERALSIDEKALGPVHPHVALDLNNLGLIYERQGKYEGAESLFKRALEISQGTLGPDETATIAANLARTSEAAVHAGIPKTTPYSVIDIEKLAKQGTAEHAFLESVRLHGIGFAPTVEVLEELRASHVPDSVLKEIWANVPQGQPPEFYLREGDRLLANGYYAEAGAYYRKILVLLPGDPVATARIERAEEQRQEFGAEAQLRASQDNERPNLGYYRQQLSSFLTKSDCDGAFYYAHKIFFIGPDQSEKAAFEKVCGPYSLSIENGTPVKLEFQRDLAGSGAHAGDRVDFTVVDPIFVNGLLVVPKGSLAWGTVVKTEGGRNTPRVGQLKINIEGVLLADGEKLSIAGAEKSRKNKKGIMIGSVLTAGPAVPFLIHGKGKDVTISAGTKVAAYVTVTVNLDPARFTTSGPAPSVARIATPPIVSGLSVISLQNQSGTDATIRLLGPSAQVLTVVDGQSFGARVAAGDYYVLVRYGKGPSEYLFEKSGPIPITEPSGKHAVVHVTLHRPAADNPKAREEFYKGQ